MLFKRPRPRLSSIQSLTAKPVRIIEAEVTELAGGGAKLKVPLRPKRAAKWLFRISPTATKTFELDALGLLVWNNCDGRTSVQQIVRKLAKQYRLNLREAQVPTLSFLQMLAQKGLIGIGVSPDDKSEASGSDAKQRRKKRDE